MTSARKLKCRPRNNRLNISNERLPALILIVTNLIILRSRKLRQKELIII